MNSPLLSLFTSVHPFTPHLLRHIYMAALSLFATEGGTLSALSQCQGMMRRNTHIHPDGERGRSFAVASEGQQLHNLCMRITRLHERQQFFVARNLFAAAFRAQMLRRKIVRQYNPFSVWYLFVAGFSVEGVSPDAARALGLAYTQSEILGAADPKERAEMLAEAVAKAIDDLEEAGAGRVVEGT